MYPDTSHIVVALGEMDAVFRISAAALLGILLGIDRSVAGKHAGMRTYSLMSMGSCLFTVVGIIASFQLAQFAAINPLQLAGSVIIGIGFVGTGLAMFHDHHPVELTTAAGIFVASAVGITAGFGLYILAIATTVLSLIIFRVFARVERVVQENLGDSHKSE